MTYKITAHNKIASASSDYSEPKISNQALPEDFPMTRCRQMNDTTILIEWERPLTPNGKIFRYKVFRGQEMLAEPNASNSAILIASLHRKVSASHQNGYFYYDIMSFLHKTAYSYKISACNGDGCSTNQKNCSCTVTTRDQKPFRVDPPTLVELIETSALLNASNSAQLQLPDVQKIVE